MKARNRDSSSNPDKGILPSIEPEVVLCEIAVWIAICEDAFFPITSKCEIQIHSRKEKKRLETGSELWEFLKSYPIGFCEVKVELSGSWVAFLSENL